MTVTGTILRFPDVQRVLVADLTALVAADHIAIETPTDLAARLPFVRVMRTSGPSDRINDFANVDIDVWADTYTAGEMLAEQIRQRLVGPPPPIPKFDRIDCPIGPRELPWGDGTIRRFNATYEVVSRRYRASI